MFQKLTIFLEKSMEAFVKVHFVRIRNVEKSIWGDWGIKENLVVEGNNDKKTHQGEYRFKRAVKWAANERWTA